MPSGGQNCKFTPERAEMMISMLSEGKPLAEIAATLGVQVQAMARWRLKDVEFDRRCMRAQDIGYEIQADSLLTIPDVYVDVQKSRLKSDNIKWLLSRRAAHKYGDRLELNVTHTADLTVALAEAKRRALPASYQHVSASDQVIETKQISSSPQTGLEPVVDEDIASEGRPQNTSEDIFD